MILASAPECTLDHFGLLKRLFQVQMTKKKILSDMVPMELWSTRSCKGGVGRNAGQLSQRKSIQSFARKVAGCSWCCMNRTDVWQLSQKVSFSPARPSFAKSPCFHTAFVWSHLSHLASEAFWSYQRLPKTCAAWKKPFFIFLKHLFTI